LVLLAASAVLLIVGAELFAEHAAAAGRRVGVSALAVALLVAGAEPEEMITAAFASARHHPGIAAGDAVGANVTMLTLVFGIAAFVASLPVGGRVRAYAAGAAAAGALAAGLVSTGHLGRPAGALLVGVYVGGVAIVWRAERHPPMIGEVAEAMDATPAKDSSSPKASASTERRTLALVLVLAGVGLMALGGRLAVDGAEKIVQSFGVSDSAVGLTLVALATTAELFALAWAALRRGVAEIAVAGVVGSAAYNATATLGVAALVRPLSTAGVIGPAWLAAGLPLVVVAAGGRRQRLGASPGSVSWRSTPCISLWCSPECTPRRSASVQTRTNPVHRPAIRPHRSTSGVVCSSRAEGRRSGLLRGATLASTERASVDGQE
jgi:cation:H+ antiporter